jgi:Ni/Fe-hydrogenase subunit HybB-like protein
MSKLLIVGLAMGGYLLLLARSAWKQGEFRQFLVSLSILGAIAAVLTAVVATAVVLDGR